MLFTVLALGGEIEVPGIEGTHTVKGPEGTTTGRLPRPRQGHARRLGARQGRPAGHGAGTTPRRLTREQRRLLEEFAATVTAEAAETTRACSRRSRTSLDEARRWPALIVRAAAADPAGELEGLVMLALDEWPPLAIEDLSPLPLPSSGLWDSTAPATTEPPPTPLHWRLGFRDDADRAGAHAALTGLDRGLAIERVELPDDDWVTRSQQALTAITAGPFVVAPPWDVPATIADGRRLIVIEPSMGFGTGISHDPAVPPRPRLGRGRRPDGRRRRHWLRVLAMAAALSGAGAVTAIDNDPDAVAAAQRSAALNRAAVRCACSSAISPPRARQPISSSPT